MCVDIVQSASQSVSIGNSESASLGSMVSIHSRSSNIGNVSPLNEDEALKIILAKHQNQEDVLLNNSIENVSNVEETEERVEEEKLNFHEEINLGNSLGRKSGWSFDENQHDVIENHTVTEDDGNVNDSINTDPKSMEGSFNALIESYNMVGGTYIRTPDLREVWQRFENRDCGDDSFTSNSDNVCILVYD